MLFSHFISKYKDAIFCKNNYPKNVFQKKNKIIYIFFSFLLYNISKLTFIFVLKIDNLFNKYNQNIKKIGLTNKLNFIINYYLNCLELINTLIFLDFPKESLGLLG